MKTSTSKPCLTWLAIVGMTMGGVQAQSDTLEMDVTFVGKRQMEVRDAIKLSSWPSLKALSTEKPEMSYELLSRRMAFVPTMTPVEATRLRVDGSLSRLYRGYARAGMGTRGTAIVDASYTDLRSRDGSWGTQFHHASTISPSSLLTGRWMDNSADFWATRFVGKEKVTVSGNLGRDRVLMYGFDSLAVSEGLNTTEAPVVDWNRGRLSANFKSHNKGSNAFNHSADVQVGWMGNNDQAFERSVRTGIEALTQVRGLDTRLGLDLQLDKYQTDTLETYNQAVVSFGPTVTKKQGPFSASLGLNFAIDADQPTRDNLGDSFHIYPQGEISVNLLRDLFVPYFRFGGSLQANNLHSLTEQNPFFSPTSLVDTTQFNNEIEIFKGFRSTNNRSAFHTGIRGTVTKALRFHLYASAQAYDDFVLFTPRFQTDSTGFREFELTYDSVGVSTLGGEAQLDLGESWRLSGGLQLSRYNLPTEDRAWNLPRTQWQASATYRLIEDVQIGITANYIGERYTITRSPNYGETSPLDNGNYELRLPGYVDLNLTTNYTYNDRLGAWLTLANVANAKYAVWGGFPVQGFQVLAGLHYAF